MAKRKNNPLFTVGQTFIVNLDDDEAEPVPVEGGGFKILPGPAGTCEYCHVKHPPGEPHNRDSLPYQIKFQTLNGRPPTWTDAMAHCTPEVREQWRAGLAELLRKHGKPVPEDLL